MIAKMTKGDRIIMLVDYVFVMLVIIITLYPLLYVFSSSLSSPHAVVRGEVWLFPKQFTLDSYMRVFANKAIWNSYLNTIWYVVVGTIVHIIMTTLTAYPLSRKKFWGRNLIMMLLVFTMYFDGGLIPRYLLVRDLGLINRRWAVILPLAINTYNLILMRTFFEGIPEELHEAARIDGSKDFGIFFRIVLPLSKPVLAVMVLFYSVARWNGYFEALIYLTKEKLYPLQLILRSILIELESGSMTGDVNADSDAVVGQTVRYATIVVATVPILCVYPFMQKYFVKGVMIGAIKG